MLHGTEVLLRAPGGKVVCLGDIMPAGGWPFHWSVLVEFSTEHLHEGEVLDFRAHMHCLSQRAYYMRLPITRAEHQDFTLG